MPQAYVDKEECIGCESCVQICPEVFEMDPDGKAEVKEGTGAGEPCVQEAMDACPAECIHWQD